MAKTIKQPEAKKLSDSDQLLADARELFDLASDNEQENREGFLDDIRFGRLEEQWPEKVAADRKRENRPMLTINKLPAIIKQVVNDARQNKPSIKVHPADSGADPDTADMMNGLIRNIEYTSNADTAYDTAVDNAASGGFGYIRVGLDYACDDTFDMDIRIHSVENPLAIYGDPFDTKADSAEWNDAFIVEPMKKDEFDKKFPRDDAVDWDDDSYTSLGTPWIEDEAVLVCEWWHREEVTKTIHKLSNGTVVDDEELKLHQEDYDLVGITVEKSRPAKSYEVTQRIMTGAEILKTVKWPGRYIPIVPVYGETINVEGKRYLRSLIRSAKDAQRMFNYWRTTSTELVALAPRAPWIGKKGAFVTDAQKWANANTVNHAHIEYDGDEMPQRQGFTGPPAGALQEALNAADDIKAVTGIYDASLGARSNETSGKAIMARQREGDVSTFHFIDNMSRGIRHLGRILIDLIPHVYTGERMIRIMGEDGKPENKQLGKPSPVMDPKTGQPVMQPNPETGQVEPAMRTFDLTAGKYDLTVTTGPSFTTRREEAAQQMTELIQAFPPAAAVVGPHLAKNLDWPGADEIAEELEALAPKPQQGLPPEVQQMIEQGKEQIGSLTQENQKLKFENQQVKNDAQLQAAKLQVEDKKLNIELAKLQQPQHVEGPDPNAAGELKIKAYDAETKRLAALIPNMTPELLATLGLQASNDALAMPMAPGSSPKGPVGKAAAAEAAAKPAKPSKKSIKLIRGPDGEVSGAEVADAEADTPPAKEIA